MADYDYLIVGAGLFGCVFAHEMNKVGKKCLVIERRNHIGGNIFTLEMFGINVHKYGAHIFHTDNKKIWEYINEFADFNFVIIWFFRLLFKFYLAERLTIPLFLSVKSYKTVDL